MTRYTVKKSKVGFGWEDGGFRQISSTYDNPPLAASDIDWNLFTSELDLSEGKPTMERDQPHYVGTDSRLPTHTFEGAYKNGELTLSGNLRYAHVLNAVLGQCTSTTTASTAIFRHTITIGDRTSFFTYFVHGNGTDKHIKALLGSKADEVTIEGKEDSPVTVELKCLNAKAVACTTDYTINSSSKSLDPTVHYFHWKHAAITLTIGGTTYTSSTKNEVEAFKISFKNNGVYKHGAPATGGQEHANYDKEGMLEVETVLTLYPEDNQLWELSPHESTYAEKTTSSTVNLTITLDKGSGANEDVISIVQTDLAVMKVTEKIQEIKENISPVEVTLRPARYSSSVYVDAYDPCEIASYTG